jgi:endonuclease/exonuclease/phosphatase family metal-dependent hydrolase
LAVVVRSWNVFHGNTVPLRRGDALERMVRLVSDDRPHVVCLQEVPVWALDHLAEWSGMAALGDVAQQPSVGPVPTTARVGRALTSLHHGLFRSAFTGQANAVLLGPDVRVLDRRVLTLNARDFRTAQSRWLGLSTFARLAWAKERRIAQVLRLVLPDGRTLLLGHLHATFYRPDERLPDAEVLRAAVFTDAAAEPGDICVLAGDFNLRAERSASLAELRAWGFSLPGPGVDHVLVRGGEPSPLEVWAAERRTVDGLVLSDHAPVEVAIR